MICGHMLLWGNTAYCVNLNGEDLSRYSNKIESLGLRKCPYYRYLSKKVTDVTLTNISQSLLHIMAGKQLAKIWYEEITSLLPCVLERSKERI